MDRTLLPLYLPMTMITLFLLLGLGLQGWGGLYNHYILIENNIVPILALASVWIISIIIYLRMTEPGPREIQVVRVRTR